MDDLIKKQATSKFADDALYEIALTYSEQNQTIEAIASLKKLLKDYPGTNIYNRTLIQLGLMTYNEGNKTEALNDYKEVFKHNPTPQESQSARARSSMPRASSSGATCRNCQSCQARCSTHPGWPAPKFWPRAVLCLGRHTQNRSYHMKKPEH